jgi:WD40 repeat protein
MNPYSACCLLCAFAALLSTSRTVSAADGKGGSIRANCPAISLEDAPRTNFGENARQPTLVVLGTARPVGTKPAAETREIEVDVEKVLFGSSPGTRLRCLAGWVYRPKATPERLILALAPALNSKEPHFEIRYSLAVEEERAVAALSAARMDFNTLSAQAILLGKETSTDADKGRIVEVTRVLLGPDALRGNKICVDLTDYPLDDINASAPAKEEMLYFVAAIEHDRDKLRFRSIRNPAGPVYLTSYRLPADQEKQVLDALKRRDQYPVVEIEADGQKVRRLEILFRGTIAEAIELLGSASEGARILGSRFLIHKGTGSHQPVIASIDNDLLGTERKTSAGYRRLHSLIQILPHLLPPETTEKELKRLVETWLTHLAKHPAEPPVVKREPWQTYFQSEETHTDVNHSLAWLLMQLDEGQVVRVYGKRLLTLRDSVKAGWKHEVQLALDVANVEDHLDLADAWPRMKGVRPLRSRTGLRHPGSKNEGVLAFSPDGKYLATAGGGDLRVWNTQNWSPACEPIPQDGSIERLVFSPDIKYLYVAGGGGGLQIHARYDWRVGKLDRAYQGHKSGLADLVLSADGKTMVTSNYYEDIIHVWDTATGRIEKSFKTPRLAHQFALSPDGSTLLRRIALQSDDREEAKTTWTVESLGPGALHIPESILAGNIAHVAFSPDGRQLLTIGGPNKEDGTSPERALRLFDVQLGFRELASSKVAMLPPRRATLYPSQGALLLQGKWSSGDLHAFSLPDLKPLKGFEKVRERFEKAEKSSGDTKSACLSPDGALLAVGVLFRPTPHLFRTNGYDELAPVDGHGDSIIAVSFPADGKILRTLGSDNTICTWDARTLKMVKRQNLPPGWSHESIREPDGRYLIGTTESDENSRTLQVFDVEAGKVIATVNVPSDAFSILRVCWINDREAVAVTGGELCHFDVTSGKVFARRKLAIKLGRNAGLTEDGKTFFVIDGGIPKYPHVRIDRVSVETGKASRVGEFSLRRFTGNKGGLVPSGKFFYIADPGFYLFERQSLKPVMSRSFRGTNSLSLDFTRDGSRFAVVTGGRIYVDLGPGQELRRWDAQTQSVVRIHDTETGRTLGAFRPSTHQASVRFAPDGKQLVVINGDGTFELWDLTGLNRF